MPKGDDLLLLVSSSCMNREVADRQERAIAWLSSQGYDYVEIDGADPDNKEK